MAIEKALFEEAGPVEGVMDTGPVAIAHFENPARRAASHFLGRVLRWQVRCLIPTSAFLGAYHVLTEYLGVDRVAAYKALAKTLDTRSPAIYQDITIDLALDALTYASGYQVESWDGYIISLAKTFGASIIYTVDRELAKKVKEVEAINPIPPDLFAEYNHWLRRRIK